VCHIISSLHSVIFLAQATLLASPRDSQFQHATTTKKPPRPEAPTTSPHTKVVASATRAYRAPPITHTNTRCIIGEGDVFNEQAVIGIGVDMRFARDYVVGIGGYNMTHSARDKSKI